jgi:hypothetical protein
MAGRGLTLAELQSAIPGPVNVRLIPAPEPKGQWVTVRWSCGCRAEGHRFKELLLLERCLDHGAIRLADLAGSAS